MPTLDAVFVDPALAWLKLKGTVPQFSTRLRAIRFDGDRVTGLDYGEGWEDVAERDVVVLEQQGTQSRIRTANGTTGWIESARIRRAVEKP